MPRITKLVGDTRLRPKVVGAVEVRLRCVDADGHTTALRQRRGDDARAAPDIEHPVARPDPGKIEEGTGQAAAPSAHEMFVLVSVDCQKCGHGSGHVEPRLHGSSPPIVPPGVKALRNV
jgi:hypothetical protein